MLDFIYQSGWGAFSILLMFQLPFLIGFLFIISRSSKSSHDKGDASEQNISKAKTAWLSLVVVLFVVVNVASISYIPAVSSAAAMVSAEDVVDVKVTAESWSYDLSEQEFTVGQTVRFSVNSVDTVHGFAIYHPKGNIIFTMMLVPGVGPSSLIHKFSEPGTYKVRCLEYCGAAHHEMNDEIIVTASSS